MKIAKICLYISKNDFISLFQFLAHIHTQLNMVLIKLNLHLTIISEKQFMKFLKKPYAHKVNTLYNKRKKTG